MKLKGALPSFPGLENVLLEAGACLITMTCKRGRARRGESEPACAAEAATEHIAVIARKVRLKADPAGHSAAPVCCSFCARGGSVAIQSAEEPSYE
jgi:hypothetical protein